MIMLIVLCFFFQAEDGIRDIGVTGVQTCALPISPTRDPFGKAFDAMLAERLQDAGEFYERFGKQGVSDDTKNVLRQAFAGLLWSKQRSEERRVGKECRSRWSAETYRKEWRRRQRW